MSHFSISTHPRAVFQITISFLEWVSLDSHQSITLAKMLRAYWTSILKGFWRFFLRNLQKFTGIRSILADPEMRRTLLTPVAAPPDLPSATAQIGNVAAASILHQDQEYVNGLRDCCVHTLHGSRNCPKPNICSGRLLLCKDFQIGACPVTEFQHGLYIHIKKNCKSAIVTSECFVFDCQSGHDYFELRQERWEEYVHKRKIDAEIGKTLKRALMSKAVHQQLDTLARAITSNATTPLPSNVISAAKNLRRKLESEYDGEQILQGDLKVEVIAALQAYDNLVRLRLQNQQALLQTASKPNQPIQLQHNQFKEQTQAPARVTTVGEGSNRTNLDNATCRQIETLERAMGNQTTPLDRIQAQGAAGKLRRKLRSKMGTGEKVIKNNLKGKVWNTLAAYNEWAKHAS